MALLKGRLEVRPLREDDTDAVVAFYEGARRADPTVGGLSAEGWRRFLAQPVNRGGRDFRVAELEGEVVAVVTSSLRDREHPVIRHFRLIVAPAHRRRGIGSEVLRSLVELDPPGTGIVLQALCPEEWTAGAAFLTARGFRCVESELEMTYEAPALEPTACGKEVTVERASEPAAFGSEVASIHNHAYAGTLSFVPYSGEEMSQLLSGGAELWIASSGGRLVGFCHLEGEPEGVWLESVAVEPSWRGRGIGMCLTSQALAAAGVGEGHPARLTVTSDNLPARALYRRLGFVDTHETRRFRAGRDEVSAHLASTRG
ncbi:GNAT family N-acetyltransferase [Archangium violaceum]|uniref:N-acetyltransferase domain-containing protein n=1 Tax=Archangium violaceum Cb vi76 TaxID=1406225 RepID=A0A084T004_9BACT|nr:GNAT family N-acetyltransferase [Archangium violaceum]KFA94039.1 hypothetical protein Q664_05205 [Archangium violaceum Cb vi76]